MRVGYECLLPGTRDTGVENSIRGLLGALVRRAPEVEFVVFTRKRGLGQTLVPCGIDAASIAAVIPPPFRGRLGGGEPGRSPSPNPSPRGGGLLREQGSKAPGEAHVTRCVSRLADWGRGTRILWQQAVAPVAARRMKLDLYHAPGYVVSPRFQVPTVVTVYDTIALEFPQFTTPANAAYYRWAIPRGVRSAAKVVVPSEFVRSRLTGLLAIPPEKVVMVPLGISPSFRPLDCDEVAERLGGLPFRLPRSFALVVGNIDKKKDLPMLLRGYSHCRARKRDRMKLVIAGRPGNDRRRVLETIRDEGIEEDVLLMGYRTEEELAALYNAAEVFLYPSHMEGFGLPPLEAMACETPAIASGAGAIPEVLGDAAILVDSQDPQDWSEAVERVLGDRDVRSRLVRDGRQRSALYTWDRAAERILEVYRECWGSQCHG